MSGPKVIRIITREEMEAIKESHLSRLQAVVDEVIGYSERHHCLNHQQIQQLNFRLNLYRNLDASEYRRIRTEIPTQIEFMLNEKQHLEEQAKKHSLSRRARFRHLKASIASLRLLYRKHAMELPEVFNLLEVTNQWLSTDEMEQLEAQIRMAFTALQTDTLSSDTASLEYRERLKAGLENVDFDSWLDGADLTQPDTATLRLESIMADLQVLDINDTSKQQFLDRASQLLTLSVSQQRDMKVDSLCIEINTLIRNARARQNKIRVYDAVLSDLAKLKVDEADISQSRLAQPELADIAELEAAIAELTRLYDTELATRTRATKTRALFAAFHKLGYQVQENMETALVQNGRLVIHKNAGSHYAVEMGGPTNLQRIQLRVVADAGSELQRTSGDDKAEEQTWCENFNSIQQELAANGLYIEIDRQLASGETLVKTVDFEASHWQSSASTHKTMQQRSRE